MSSMFSFFCLFGRGEMVVGSLNLINMAFLSILNYYFTLYTTQ